MGIEAREVAVDIGVRHYVVDTEGRQGAHVEEACVQMHGRDLVIQRLAGEKGTSGSLKASAGELSMTLRMKPVTVRMPPIP